MTETTTSPSSRPTDRQARADHLFSQVIGWLGVLLLIWVLHAVISTWSWRVRTPMFFVFGKEMERPAPVLLLMSLVLMVVGFWGRFPLMFAALRRWAKRGGLNAALVIVGVVVVTIMVNYLVQRNAVWRLDLTKNHRFSLAPQSKKVLRNLAGKVDVTVYLTTDAEQQGLRNRAEALFGLYETAAPGKIAIAYKNPFADLQAFLAKKSNLGGNLTGAVLEYNGKREDIQDFSEKDITSALIKFARPTVRKLYFLEGHNEQRTEGGATPDRGLQSAVALLRSQQWQVETLTLVGKDSEMPSPDEAAALIIAGPEKELFAGEAAKINGYLQQGGRVLVTLRAGGAKLADFLQKWGIVPTSNLAFGTASEAGQFIIVTENELKKHEITKNVGTCLLGPAIPLNTASPAPKGVTVTKLISSGQRVRVARNFKQGVPVKAADLGPGPVDLALIAEKEVVPAKDGKEAKRARLLVVGDSMFSSDYLAQAFPNGFNLNLYANMVNWLAEEDALVSIPAKDEQLDRVFATDDQKRLLLTVFYLDFPLLAAVLGFVVYLKRR